MRCRRSILVGQLTPSSARRTARARTVNDVLGGTFTSRLNMNLREDKHWSYGVRSCLPEARASGPGCCARRCRRTRRSRRCARSQRSSPSSSARSRRPPMRSRRSRNRDVRALSGRYETNAAVSGAIADMIVFDRPDDYVRTLKDRDRDADRRCRTGGRGRGAGPVASDLGDRRRSRGIERPIRELGLGDVQVLDADGRAVR